MVNLGLVYYIFEGSLEVKLPTIWTDGKAEVGRIREEKRREEKKKEDQKRERVRRKKMQVREKVEKSRKTLFFPMICETAERKVRTTEDITKMRKKQMRGSTEGSLYSMSHEIMHGLTRMLF